MSAIRIFTISAGLALAVLLWTRTQAIQNVWHEAPVNLLQSSPDLGAPVIPLRVYDWALSADEIRLETCVVILEVLVLAAMDPNNPRLVQSAREIKSIPGFDYCYEYGVTDTNNPSSPPVEVY